MADKVWKAYCSECEVVTEMTRVNSTTGDCHECNKHVELTQNPIVKHEIMQLELMNEGLMTRIYINRERIEKLSRTLNPVEHEAPVKWERSETPRECRECGRTTHHVYGNKPLCYLKCKPRTGKLTIDDKANSIAREIILDFMQSLEMGGATDDDSDDTEYIKKGNK